MFWCDLDVMKDLGFPQTAQRIREELKQAWNCDNIIEWAYDNGFRIRKNKTSDIFTDEANENYQWSVEREYSPFCDKDGNRGWNGPTAKQALSKAIHAVSSHGNVTVPPWILPI
jgi:hypothetical protein